MTGSESSASASFYDSTPTVPFYNVSCDMLPELNQQFSAFCQDYVLSSNSNSSRSSASADKSLDSRAQWVIDILKAIPNLLQVDLSGTSPILRGPYIPSSGSGAKQFTLQIDLLNLHIRKHFGVASLRIALQMYVALLWERWQCANTYGYESQIDGEDTEAEEGIGSSTNACDDSNSIALDGHNSGTQQLNHCKSNALLELIRTELNTLHLLKWHVLYASDMEEAVQRAITYHVQETCRGDFESKFLSILQNWLHHHMFPFVCALFHVSTDAPVHATQSMDSTNEDNVDMSCSGPDVELDITRVYTTTDSLWKQLAQSLLTAFSALRSEELFAIVADFPDSLRAVREFKQAAIACNCLGSVGRAFRLEVTRRLLHPGASTQQIIDMYLGMIRTLRIIDPSDLLLNYVATPVRAYLRRRSDTVRCVVSMLLLGREGDLHTEMRRGGSLEFGLDDDDEEAGPGTAWQPRKRDPDLAEGILGGQGHDALALLISIYGSTDLFVADYRQVLAEKLVSNMSYSADAEMATLELLKIRFGDDALHSCAVMLRDLDESRRINQAMRKFATESPSSPQPTWVDMLILSDHYWPASSNNSSLILPSQVKQAIDEYIKLFATVKKPRHLVPSISLGTVDLSLDFEDGSTRSFAVTPTQATVILLITEACSKPSMPDMSLFELATKMGLLDDGITEVRKAAAYWVTRGVLRRHVLTADQILERASRESMKPTDAVQASYVDPFSDEASGEHEAEKGILFTIDENQSARAIKDQQRQRHSSYRLHGAVGESTDVIHGEEDDDKSDHSDSGSDSDDAGAAMAAAAKASEKGEMVAIEGYVRGILSGHGTMELSRLHTMLKLVMAGQGGGTEYKFSMNLITFQKFLNGLVEKDLLEQEAGVYRLRK